MSSGPFEFTFYGTDNGDIATIRVQPETLALTIGTTANAAVSGPSTPGFPSAQTSQSRNAIGVNARRVRCVYTSAASAGLPGLSITLPWLDPATFATIAEGETGTYQAEPIQLRRKTNERIV